MTDPFEDSDDGLSLKPRGPFREKGMGGLMPLETEEDDYGEEISAYASSVRRAARRLDRWDEMDERSKLNGEEPVGVVGTFKKGREQKEKREREEKERERERKRVEREEDDLMDLEERMMLMKEVEGDGMAVEENDGELDDMDRELLGEMDDDVAADADGDVAAAADGDEGLDEEADLDVTRQDDDDDDDIDEEVEVEANGEEQENGDEDDEEEDEGGDEEVEEADETAPVVENAETGQPAFERPYVYYTPSLTPSVDNMPLEMYAVSPPSGHSTQSGDF
jgi:hypothetical protein